jgi:MurNAc alpha-1-phosphate uridylyltransferase
VTSTPDSPGRPGVPVAGLCAVALAAGEGLRLRPLTTLVPKALCPVDNVPLLDRVLARLAAAGLSGPADVSVNACYLADQVVAQVGNRAHLSVESPPALGTAGGVANLRDWIAGRHVLVCNADAYLSGDSAPVAALLEGWDEGRIRVLVAPAEDGRPGDFGPGRTLRYAGMCLLPWGVVATLTAVPSELFVAWREAEAAGTLEPVEFGGTFIDCGTPADYLAANLHASGGASVVGAGATVAGELERAVVWPGASVAAGERLVGAIRARQPDGSPLTLPAGVADGGVGGGIA